jgi:hypothetical protein
VDQAFTQVKANIINRSINLTDVPGLITVLEAAFRDADCMTIPERKLGVLK